MQKYQGFYSITLCLQQNNYGFQNTVSLSKVSLSIQQNNQGFIITVSLAKLLRIRHHCPFSKTFGDSTSCTVPLALSKLLGILHHCPFSKTVGDSTSLSQNYQGFYITAFRKTAGDSISLSLYQKYWGLNPRIQFI